ncbi:hypothetical protein Hanom_Chr09g00860361 [Helianthus anomalus]
MERNQNTMPYNSIALLQIVGQDLLAQILQSNPDRSNTYKHTKINSRLCYLSNQVLIVSVKSVKH